MFALVFEHQRPRIMYHLRRLKEAFNSKHISGNKVQQKSPKSLRAIATSQPVLRLRCWTDDTGLEFEIPINGTENVDALSEDVATGESYEGADLMVSELFNNVKELCKDIVQEHENRLLKHVMQTLFELLQGIKAQSALKARLHRHFKNDLKRNQEARMALLSLRKIYHSVHTFIKAAERLRIFRSIQCVAVPYKPHDVESDPSISRQTPLTVAESLGLSVQRSWKEYLRDENKQFKDLVEEKSSKRNFHAELQLSYHHCTLLSPDENKHIHAYIGCSKKSCLLCYLFVKLYGDFDVRGTHETLFHRWELHQSFPIDDSGSTSRFRSATRDLLNLLKIVLAKIFNGPRIANRRDLLAQSSAALSSAQFEVEKESAKLEKSHRELQSVGLSTPFQSFLLKCRRADQLKRRMTLMPAVFDDGLLINEIPGKPGYAYVIGGGVLHGKEMTLGEADSLRDNHIRSSFGFEPRDEMPPKRILVLRHCKSCRHLSGFRCSACRTAYCSKGCQIRDWHQHVFSCCVKGRPSDVDRLKMVLRWAQGLAYDKLSSEFFLALYSDDDLCKTFGFDNCADKNEVTNLMCIYGNLLRNVGSTQLQKLVNGRILDQFINKWILAICSNESDIGEDCHCFRWFLDRSRSSEDFVIPNPEGSYVYQNYAWNEVFNRFALERLESKNAVSPRLSLAEKRVHALYSILFRDFNNIPDAAMNTQEWIGFGFCFCTTISQCRTLAAAYLELVDSNTTFQQIATSWENRSLAHLMRNRGIDTSLFEKTNVNFHEPSVDEIGIYRLMVEIRHALSGYHCPCFTTKCANRSRYETILSLESEGDYGFLGTNAWERWQLMNFYSRIFAHPNFAPREMQKARRSSDPKALERYLESLVPGFRRQIGNKQLADVMFPRLGTKLSFPNGRPHCQCVIHSVWMPEGLDMMGLASLARRTEGSESEEGPMQ